MNNKLVVYTALFGDYDELNEPTEKYEGCDFICFTDQKHITSNIWKICLVDECDLPANLMNRKYKILPHQFLSSYEYSLYIDSNVLIIKNPLDLKNKYLLASDLELVLPKHFARNCIYDEAFTLLRSGRTIAYKVFYQMLNYRNNGYTCQTKMGENNILLRKHQQTSSIMDLWWSEILKETQRDQLSLAYILWKTDFKKWQLMQESSRDNFYFSINQHKKSSNIGLAKKIFLLLFCAIPFYAIKITYLSTKIHQKPLL